MPDISMCRNHNCDRHRVCYRFTATPCDAQCFSAFEPDLKNRCDYFIPNAPSPQIVKRCKLQQRSINLRNFND